MDKIFAQFNFAMGKCSYLQINAVSFLLVMLISQLNLIYGYEISLSILFLIPIAISTWYGGHRTGIVYCILSFIVYVDQLIFAHRYASHFSLYWNSVSQLILFLLAEGMLNYLKVHLSMAIAQSRTDGLTNLLNVRGFSEQAEKLFDVAARNNRHVTLACIDLDDSKQVDDKLNCNEEDKVLRVIGERIRSALRISDVAGRVGVDKFAIVLPETDEAGARVFFDKLRGALLQKMKKQEWPISFSIGVVTFNSTRSSLEDAFRAADSLIYQVKTGGGESILFVTYPEK